MRLSDAFVAAGKLPEFRALCEMLQLFPDVYNHQRLALLAQGQKT